jgi:spore coat polysaccharide biosynthesis protein SpsF (cytidylyltransferase family)
LEGDSTVASIAELKSKKPLASLGQDGTSLHRRTITMIEDFDVVHNVLYYIYTNRITFSTVASQEPESKGNQPNIADAEDIFALAHRLDLEDLKQKALEFLGRSCTLRNIMSRVFTQSPSLYDEVGKVYDE